MRRVVSVYLPTWSTDLWRRRNASRAPAWDSPLVVAASDGPRRVLVAVDRAARRLNLRPGMTVAHAQAAVPDLTVVEADPEAAADALQDLGAWCLRRYSPLVALDLPDGLWIEVAGAAHLFQGEARLIEDLVAGLARRALSARAAVADTPGAAWAVARFAPREPVIASGAQAASIAELPVRSLRLSRETVAGLVQLGIERVGQLAAKPRAPLRLRFGEEAVLRFDQALGRTPEPLAYLASPKVPRVRLAFAEPIGAPETLVRVTERLLSDLCAVLERQGVGVRRLDLLFRRVDGVSQGVRVATAQPTRAVRHLLRLFVERLALVDPGFGIDEAVLAASAVEWFDATQAPLGDLVGEGADADLAELVDRLTVRLGTRRVFRIAPVASGLPERSVRRVGPLAAVPDADWPAGLPRPVRLLRPPESVMVVALAPDHPPALFVWRRSRLRVARADGPERVHGEWWVSDAEGGLVRDYYRVETTAGDRFWLFRDAPALEGGRWWLHGVGEA
ncbi:DNA polymerase Y family protein [Methylobacterium sp. J-068]|uniref:DNA polymerase Y family protein n=1 Tax=Methylobacterium sp. J-068 TaxID=2836649 RepID=UPI001FB8C1DE|nr:DNA polymerase Y family protein [Methylobacterium sp. J-068]MCJ2034250.1 DNA polymerase Y family protein [Methylobacterium sp. J-068]